MLNNLLRRDAPIKCCLYKRRNVEYFLFIHATAPTLTSNVLVEGDLLKALLNSALKSLLILVVGGRCTFSWYYYHATKLTTATTTTRNWHSGTDDRDEFLPKDSLGMH